MNTNGTGSAMGPSLVEQLRRRVPPSWVVLVAVVLFFGTPIAECTAAEGGWIETTPAVDASLRTVTFVDGEHAWAGGESLWTPDAGILLKTTDEGSSWSLNHTFPYVAADAPHFDGVTGITEVTPDLVYAFNSDIAWSSTDQGASWDRQSWAWDNASAGDPPWWCDVRPSFLRAFDESTFVVFDFVCCAFETNDGGGTWAKFPQDPPIISTPFAFAFANRLDAWIGQENGGMVHTSDGCLTWERQRTGTYRDIHDMAFVDASTGWACADHGVIIHTDDGGETWVRQPSGLADAVFYGVDFVDSERGWVVGANKPDATAGIILSTTDGGETWRVESTPRQQVLYDVDFLPDGSAGIAVGEATDTGMIAAASSAKTRVSRADPAPPLSAVWSWRPDTRRPVTLTRAASVRSGGSVSLRYRVEDTAPSCGRADVRVRIFRGSKLVKASPTLRDRKENVWAAWSFRCHLARGRYTFRVVATDAAGHRARKIGVATLTVR